MIPYSFTPGLPGSLNMAIDTVLFEAHEIDLWLRFYTWAKPTLSLGIHQQVHDVISGNIPNSLKFDIVRRPTAGFAVLHHYELTYALSGSVQALPWPSPKQAYFNISSALIHGLKLLGIPHAVVVEPRHNSSYSAFCFAQSARYEISVNGKKLIGSAQKWTRTRFLQHGSILLDFDDQYGRLFRKGLFQRQSFTTLRELCGDVPLPETLIEHFVKGFETIFQTTLRFEPLPESYLEKAEKIRHTFSVDL